MAEFVVVVVVTFISKKEGGERSVGLRGWRAGWKGQEEGKGSKEYLRRSRRCGRI